MEDILVTRAKFAEQTERYNDMSKFMRELVNKKPDLSEDGRNLLSVAYKNVVGSKRSAWRILQAAGSKEHEPPKKEVLEEYTKAVEAELVKVCEEILALLQDHLIPNNEATESQVFYYKMKGDYYRYISEVKAGSEEIVNSAKTAYEEASKQAQELKPTHPIRLGLALNMSVFFYEILNNPEEACALAKKAFDGAIAEIDSLKEDTYKDSTLIMQLLRDNLTLWTSEVGDGGDEEQQ